MNYSELLSPVQYKKLLGGNAMNPFITVGSSTSCKKCGGKEFAREVDEEDGIKFPVCKSCRGRPKIYRVGFSLPVLGSDKFRKLLKTKNEVGETLNTLSKAKSFKKFLENKLKIEGVNFDPREIGGEEERRLFIVSYLASSYFNHCQKRYEKNDLTPGGFRKIERVLRLHILPTFGNYRIKQITYQVVAQGLVEISTTPSIEVEICKVLRMLLVYAETKGLIPSVPKMPVTQKTKTFKADDFYTAKERDLVIAGIKNQKHKLAIQMLSNYVARVSEVRCLRWSDIDLKNGFVSFSRHLSEGGKGIKGKELDGLKSSPERVLTYPLYPGLREKLMQLGIKSSDELVFNGRNGFLGKNALWSSWTRSVDRLIEAGKLDKKVDLHRGTRSSTLSHLLQKGHTYEELNELYGGNIRTMEKYYAKKRVQNVAHLWEES